MTLREYLHTGSVLRITYRKKKPHIFLYMGVWTVSEARNSTGAFGFPLEFPEAIRVRNNMAHRFCRIRNTQDFFNTPHIVTVKIKK